MMMTEVQVLLNNKLLCYSHIYGRDTYITSHGNTRVAYSTTLDGKISNSAQK